MPNEEEVFEYFVAFVLQATGYTSRQSTYVGTDPSAIHSQLRKEIRARTIPVEELLSQISIGRMQQLVAEFRTKQGAYSSSAESGSNSNHDRYRE